MNAVNQVFLTNPRRAYKGKSKGNIVKFIRKKVLNGELMLGFGANLGSSLTVEMIGLAGFDWTWIDMEHGSGDYSELVPQMQAASIGNAPAIVRIAWNEPLRFKRVLDLGAAGIMIPYVNTEEEAKQASKSLRYPPEGIRGIAKFNRACGYGQNFNEYYKQANNNLLTVVQIESDEGVKNAHKIAAVVGVDVLFVGPLDLSVNLGVMRQFQHPDYLNAMKTIVAACKINGKAAGTLVHNLDELESLINLGFTFLVVGTDGGSLMNSLNSSYEISMKYKKIKK